MPTAALNMPTAALRENCPNAELFLVRFFQQSECGKIRTRNNSVFGHFSRTASYNDTATMTIEKNEDQWSKISNSCYRVQTNFNGKDF